MINNSIKVGVCLLLLAREDDPLGLKAIPYISDSGYDYVELPLARLLLSTEQEIETLYTLLEKYGLKGEVFNNAIPFGMPVIGPSRNGETIASYVERSILLAKRFNTSLITLNGASKRYTNSSFLWETEGIQQYIEFIRAFASAGRKYGVHLAIEPINDAEQSYINKVSAALCVANKSCISDLSIIVDTYHFWKQGDCMEDLLAICPNKLSHIHIAAGKERVFPKNIHRHEIESFLEPLLKAGYCGGRVSIEAYCEEYAKDISCAINVLRDVLTQ